MLKRVLAGVVLALEFASLAWAQGAASFDGQYVGELTLTRVITGDCTPPPLGSLYPLTIAAGQVRFAYVPRFDTTLSGRVAGNGSFKATARVKRGVIQMTGRTDGNHLTASIVSPSCHYNFQARYQ
jgi:hypothetical protein